MQVVAKQQLQRVLAGFEGQFRRAAAVTEVNMIGIGRNRQAQLR